MDPSNVSLKASLKLIRRRDRVWTDVPASGVQGHQFKDLQNIAISNLTPENMPPAVFSVMTGDLQKLQSHWERWLLHYRQSGSDVLIPIMHFPVLGARKITPTPIVIDNLKKVIDFLFDRGVRLDARDRCGYTAVMHAAGPCPQPALLEHLLDNGADPDIKSVFGTVALTDAAKHHNRCEIGKWRVDE